MLLFKRLYREGLMVAQTFRENHGRIMQRDSETQDMNTGSVFLFLTIVISFLNDYHIKGYTCITVCCPYILKVNALKMYLLVDYSTNLLIMHLNKVWLIFDLGNDVIHDLTKSGKVKLRIELKKFNGEQDNVTYSTFKVRKC